MQCIHRSRNKVSFLEYNAIACLSVTRKPVGFMQSCFCAGFHIFSWTSHGVCMESTWCPHLKPCGVHMETMEMTWKQQGKNKMCSFQANCKPQLRQDMETMQFPPGNDIISTHRNDVEMMLFPSCGI